MELDLDPFSIDGVQVLPNVNFRKGFLFHVTHSHFHDVIKILYWVYNEGKTANDKIKK